jgi:hypothetical protein
MIIPINSIIYFCCCGCGQIVKPGNKYVSGGHVWTGKKRPEHSKALTGKKRPDMSAKTGEKNHMFGRKRPDMTGSNSCMHNPEIKQKCINSRKWYKHSEETIKKMSEVKIGRKMPWTSERNKKYSGALSFTWKGGISCEPYCIQWSDKEYKQSIKERDGNKCLNPYCNNKTDKIFLHHINYDKKDCRPSNLITVCSSCNSKANSNREFHKSWYEAILYRRYFND